MFVYFIQAANGGPVKIGKADRPDRRLAQLQPANPIALVIRAVCAGGFVAERELQVRFAESRIDGTEWFNSTAALEEMMAALPTWDEVQDGAECPELYNSNVQVLTKLYDLGYTFQDLAELIGCTRQRCHQILTTERTKAGTLPGLKGKRSPRPPRPDEPIESAYQRLSADATPLLAKV